MSCTASCRLVSCYHQVDKAEPVATLHLEILDLALERGSKLPAPREVVLEVTRAQVDSITVSLQRIAAQIQ